MKKNIIKILAIVATGSLLMVSCTKGQKEEKQEEKAINVQVEAVSSQELDQIYDFTSTIEPKVKNYISSAGGSRIEKIYVEVGSRVSKGQVLVKMENTNVMTAQAQLDNIELELNRTKALYQSGGTSKQNVDQLQLQYDVAKKNLKNLKENINLVSPISGIVTAKNFDNGDVAGSQPILQVMQISPVKLKFSINESFYGRVKLGMSVTAKVEVFEDEEFKGKITLISPVIDPNSRSFFVEVEFNNANQKLRPGMFGKAELNLGRANTILVSDKSIVKQVGTNDKYVYVLKNDNTVEYRQVVLGRRMGDKYAILDGLNDGEKVVVSDFNKLKQGAKVKVVK